MGTLRSMWSTQIPGSGASLASPGSQLVTYDSDYINWPTLASKTGTTASSVFVYGTNVVNTNSAVKLSLASVRSAFGVIQA